MKKLIPVIIILTFFSIFLFANVSAVSSDYMTFNSKNFGLVQVKITQQNIFSIFFATFEPQTFNYVGNTVKIVTTYSQSGSNIMPNYWEFGVKYNNGAIEGLGNIADRIVNLGNGNYKVEISFVPDKEGLYSAWERFRYPAMTSISEWAGGNTIEVTSGTTNCQWSSWSKLKDITGGYINEQHLIQSSKCKTQKTNYRTYCTGDYVITNTVSIKVKEGQLTCTNYNNGDEDCDYGTCIYGTDTIKCDSGKKYECYHMDTGSGCWAYTGYTCNSQVCDLSTQGQCSDLSKEKCIGSDLYHCSSKTSAGVTDKCWLLISHESSNTKCQEIIDGHEDGKDCAKPYQTGISQILYTNGCSISHTREEYLGNELDNDDWGRSLCKEAGNCKAYDDSGNYTITCTKESVIGVSVPKPLLARLGQTILNTLWLQEESKLCLAKQSGEDGGFCVTAISDMIKPYTKADCQTNTIIFIVGTLLLVILISRM